MKRHAAAVLVLCAAILTYADTTRVMTGTLLNLYSLNKTHIQYSYMWTPCSVPTDTLNRYDFIYYYFDWCTCICPCCPTIKISSPRSFYISKAPMTYNQFNPSRLSQDFNLISGPDQNIYQYPCALPAVTYGYNGSYNPTPVDSIKNRLFAFLSNNGGLMPFYVYMLVNVDALMPRSMWCNPNDPLPGGQSYPLYDTARISIYNTGIIASVKPAGKPDYVRIVPKGLEIYSIMGKRVDNVRPEELPAGIYIINGKTTFLQKNTSLSLFNRLKTMR